MLTPPGQPEPDARTGLMTAGLLALGVGVSNGFARFAYALILPSMRSDLGWNYTQGGWNNTASAIGYLIGAMVAFRLTRRFKPQGLFVAGLWATTVGILATGFTADFIALCLIRTLAGISGAIAFISGSVLAANVFPGDARRSATAIMVYYSGGGLAILFAGATIPFLLAGGGDAAWPYAWIGLGVVSVVATAAAWSAAARIAAPVTSRVDARWEPRPFIPLIAGYALFGLGYIAYMTFVVAWMRERGASAFEIALFYSTLGLAIVVAQPLWQRPLGHWQGGQPLATAMAFLAVGSAVPLLGTSVPLMLASAIIFGCAAFVTPAAVTAFSRKSLPPSQWGEAVAGFTTMFAICQCLGPVLSGAVSDAAGTLMAGLGISSVILAVGAGVSLLQRDLEA